MLQEESVVYEVGQLCPGESTEAKWDSALEPHFQACHPLEMPQVLLKPWLCLGGPGLGCSLQFALMSSDEHEHFLWDQVIKEQ